jgi:hypothetical protein
MTQSIIDAPPEEAGRCMNGHRSIGAPSGPPDHKEECCQ